MRVNDRMMTRKIIKKKKQATCPFKYKQRKNQSRPYKNKDRQNIYIYMYIKGKDIPLIAISQQKGGKLSSLSQNLADAACCILSAERQSAQRKCTMVLKGHKSNSVGLWSLSKSIPYISMHDVCRSSILCLSGIAKKKIIFSGLQKKCGTRLWKTRTPVQFDK